MAEEKKLPSVRQHADELITQMIADRQIAPDAGAAAAANDIPVFSKGTAALDPNTGQPIVPSAQAELPGFTDGSVAVPDQAAGPTTEGTPVKTAQQILAEGQERVAQPAPPAQEAGSEAAEQAAQAVADAFAEFEEFEVEDADLDLKYPIRVPKQYATSAKRGYPRRASYDRSVSWLKNAEPILKQMVEDGRINQVLPLIKAAIENDAYGNYVAQGYERMQKGLPLIEQARQEAEAAGRPAEQATFDLEAEDPFFAERVRPILAKYETLEQKFQAMETERQQQAQRQRDQQRSNAERGQQMALAHADLHQMFPQVYSGDLNRDQSTWQRVVQYAKEAGYVDAYGIRAGLLFAGQTIQQIDQERIAATGSPAVAAMTQAESRNLELARTQAAAASRTVGAGAQGQSAPPLRLNPPSTKNPDGSLKPLEQFVREQQAYLAMNGAPA
jgi:hypothetical protein